MENKSNRARETKYAHLSLEDGILFFTYKPTGDIEVDLEVAKIGVQDRVAFCNGQAYPSLFDITPIKKFTKEARDYLANEGNDLVTASAILVNNALLRITVNFFIAVNKPKNPTRIFTDRNEAIHWLKMVSD